MSPQPAADRAAFPTQNLKRLVSLVAGADRPQLLDIGRLSDQNIEWFIRKGFRVFVDDQFRCLPPPVAPAPKGGKTPLPSPLPPLAYPDARFDVVVAWDLFDYLAPSQADALTAEVRRILKPRGLLLAFFHFDRKAAAQHIRYRVIQDDRLEYLPATAAYNRRVYENTEIQTLFREFDFVNSCLLANQVREMLVRRKV
jgi:SAM-dependent methyltransferase